LEQHRFLVGIIKDASHQDEASLRRWLQSEKVEMRFGAAFVIGEKKVPVPHELIAVLGDRNLDVQQAARRSLVLLANRAMEKPKESPSTTAARVNRFLRLGPNPTSNKKTIATAEEKWKDWWEHNDPDLGKLRNPLQGTDSRSSGG
jgi:hypothetical protein